MLHEIVRRFFACSIVFVSALAACSGTVWAQEIHEGRTMRVLEQTADETVEYDDQGMGAVLSSGVARNAPGWQVATVRGRSLFRRARDGAAFSLWRRDIDCGPRNLRSNHEIRMRSDGTLISVQVDPSPWHRAQAGSPDAQLSAIACARTDPDRPEDPLPAGSEVEDDVLWSEYNPQSVELRSIEQDLVHQCRARGRHAVPNDAAQFATDADLDGDADDFIFSESQVECVRPGGNLGEGDSVCADRICRQWVYVNEGAGLVPAWAGSDPVISGNGAFTGRPARAGENSYMRPMRWNGRALVAANGPQVEGGDAVEIDPDAFTGSNRVNLPIRVDCLVDTCSWMRERARTALPASAGERLFRLTMQLGTSEFMQDQPEFYHALVGVEWLTAEREVLVLCSVARPAVLAAEGGGYRYHLVDVDVAVADGGARRLYIAVCHPGTRPSDRAAVVRITDARPRGRVLDGRVQRVEDIPVP